MNPLTQPKIVEKPWGREIWYADATAYAGKILEVTKGHRLSLHTEARLTGVHPESVVAQVLAEVPVPVEMRD